MKSSCPLFPVHVLWWFESADQRAAIRHEAHDDARVVAAGKNSSTPPHGSTHLATRLSTITPTVSLHDDGSHDLIT